MEIMILIGLIVLNGIFAMSEIALVTARKARLMKLAADGDSAASVALKLGEDPTKFLSTIQIGITSIGILNGIVGEAVLAAPLSHWLQSFGVPQSAASIGATAAVVIVVTYVSIVVGELVPKRIGQISPEPIARLVARPMQILALVTRPFVLLLTVSTHALLRLMGVKQNNQSGVTEEEIHAMLEEGSESGVIEQHQHEMVRNVFRLDDRQLGSLMIPRSDVVYIDVQRPPEENLQILIESEHSRFPVCDGKLDKLLGVIHAKQALARVAKGEVPDYSANLHQALLGFRTTAEHLGDGLICELLVLLNDVHNLFGRRAGMACELSDFVGNHSESPPLFSGTCRFNRCIQGKKVGLRRNTANGLND